MKYCLLIATAITLLATSCNKPDTVENTQDRLRAGTWRQTGGNYSYYDAGIGRDSITEYWSTVESCVKDNTFQFKEVYEGIQNLGAEKCSAGEPESKPFHWQLTKNDTHLLIYNAGETFQEVDDIDARILTLSGDRMVLQYKAIGVMQLEPTYDTITVTNIYQR